mmetsp:Transcript_649/g.827  ORF Transcript_649/g.827 Transcript_649/m.827 type:complete len:232 (+) Transcript_649:1104-1799(+)
MEPPTKVPSRWEIETKISIQIYCMTRICWVGQCLVPSIQKTWCQVCFCAAKTILIAVVFHTVVEQRAHFILFPCTDTLGSRLDFAELSVLIPVSKPQVQFLAQFNTPLETPLGELGIVRKCTHFRQVRSIHWVHAQRETTITNHACNTFPRKRVFSWGVEHVNLCCQISITSLCSEDLFVYENMTSKTFCRSITNTHLMNFISIRKSSLNVIFRQPTLQASSQSLAVACRE